MSQKQTLDFKEIARQAQQSMKYLSRQWLPDIKDKGNHYAALNPTRDDKNIGNFMVFKNTVVFIWQSHLIIFTATSGIC